MRKKVGLWIDHEKAVIVFVSDKGEEIKLINSEVKKHTHPSGISHSENPYGKESVTKNDIREREFSEHLRVYYEKVISCIRDVESIFIFGPGEAKVELKKRIEKDNLKGKVVSVETDDRLTDPQIVAKVKNYFK